ncbi:MAG: hypothetical protein NVS3B14_08940 [Ktedonobacteraceae bacterium]
MQIEDHMLTGSSSGYNPAPFYSACLVPFNLHARKRRRAKNERVGKFTLIGNGWQVRGDSLL